MLSARPLVSSIRGVTKCSSTRPPPTSGPVCWCRTQVMSNCSGSSPAKAKASKASIAAICSATLGASSGAKDSTPCV